MNTEITKFIKDLTTEGDNVTISSLKVAERFGKRHDDVLKAIRNLGCSPEFYLRNFAEVIHEYSNGKGGLQTGPAYEITRDGFALLAMGFTGPEAMKWKVAYIDAFNYLLRVHMQSLREKAIHHFQHPLAIKNRNRISARDMTMLEEQRFTTLRRIREMSDPIQQQHLYISLQMICQGMGRSCPSRQELGLPPALDEPGAAQGVGGGSSE